MTKWHVYIFAILTFIWETSAATKDLTLQSAGTVLFHGKACWQHEDVVLLSMRQLMQNLVPTNTLNVDNDSFVTALMDYFQLSVQVVEEMSSGKPKDMLLLALCDAIGGYLHYYVIPVTRQAFYAGNVRYANAERIFTLYRRIVSQLDTSTRGWACPIDAAVFPIKVYPLQINPPQKCEDACSELITSDRLTGSHFEGCGKQDLIPMPYLDDEAAPTAIAVPFKKCTLRKLASPSSAFLVEKYYVASTKCMISKSATREQIMQFNEKYCEWLSASVLPHLKDDNWYAAFGGVLKILETMKGYGICTAQSNGFTMVAGHGGTKPSKEPYAGVVGDVGLQPGGGRLHNEPTEEENSAAVTRFILMALGLGIIAAWLCCGIIYLCVRGSSRNSKNNKRLDVNKSQDDSFQFINTFVQVFYDIKDRLSNRSSDASSTSKETSVASSTTCTYEMDSQDTNKKPGAKNLGVNKTKSAPLPQAQNAGSNGLQRTNEDDFESISLSYTSDSGTSSDYEESK